MVVLNHFRILRKYLPELNARRSQAHARITKHGGRRTAGGRLWYQGGSLPDDRVEEFVELRN